MQVALLPHPHRRLPPLILLLQIVLLQPLELLLELLVLRGLHEANLLLGQHVAAHQFLEAVFAGFDLVLELGEILPKIALLIQLYLLPLIQLLPLLIHQLVHAILQLIRLVASKIILAH